MLLLPIHRPVRTKKAIPFISLLIISMLTTAVHALDSDRDQAVQLEADHAIFNQKTGVTVYSGNVIITQGTIKIQADSVTANLDENSSIKDVTAIGKPAKFQQKISPDKGIAYGEGDQVYYDAVPSQITLTGHAKITQDGSTFNGNTLRYGMKQGDIEGNGNKQQRVQMIIPPSSKRVSTTLNSK